MNDAPLYQGYDQAGLDAQYNNRARVPEHADIHAGYQAQADAVLADFDTRLDVSYGPSAEETLDIYLPKPAPPASAKEGAPTGGMPINVFLHGGYWFSRHKNDYRFLARGMIPSGAALIVVNYALVPSVDLDEVVRQCRAAIAWTYRNAVDFGGDPNRLFVSGHSAGGHLTAMMMSTVWPALGDDLPGNIIKGGCALSGIFDLTPIPLSYMQETLQFTPDQVARNSPVTLSPSTKAPLIVGVGGDESEEFIRQSQVFAEHWGGPGAIECWMMTLEGINHFTILGEYADPKSVLAQAVLQQMGLG
jgi:arylformamidase